MIIKKLEEFGITIDSLLDAGMDLYIGSNEERDRVKEKLKEILLKQLSNPNVSTLLIAAICWIMKAELTICHSTTTKTQTMCMLMRLLD